MQPYDVNGAWRDWVEVHFRRRPRVQPFSGRPDHQRGRIAAPLVQSGVRDEKSYSLAALPTKKRARLCMHLKVRKRLRFLLHDPLRDETAHWHARSNRLRPVKQAQLPIHNSADLCTIPSPGRLKFSDPQVPRTQLLNGLARTRRPNNLHQAYAPANRALEGALTNVPDRGVTSVGLHNAIAVSAGTLKRGL